MPATCPFDRQTIRALVLAGTIPLWLGCGSEDRVQPGTGRIVVTVATSGAEPDPDGYILSLDGLQGTAIEADATRTLEVDEGTHTLVLAGLAGNCALDGGEPRRSVVVEADATLEVAFGVTCSATTGGLRIITVTEGDGPDPDGYLVAVDQQEPRPIGDQDTLELTALEAGDHQVRLLDVAENCTVDEGDRTATVTAGEIIEIAFRITCLSGVHRWTRVASGTGADLSDVWGTSSTDVFTVGEIATDDGGFEISSVILHYAGSGWSQQRRLSDLSLRGVWGSSPTDVYAVGFNFFTNDGKVLHYDGSQWSEVPGFAHGRGEEFALVAVWGNSASDIFVVGSVFQNPFELSLIFHWDGSTWQRMPVGDVAPSLIDVWGSGPTDVYAVGRDLVADPATAVILRFDGATWTPILQQEDLSLNSIWGSSSTDIFAAGFTVEETDGEFVVAGAILHYDGQTWMPMSLPPCGVLQDLWGNSATDVFAVGDDGVVLHYDGTEWTATTPTNKTLLGVWGSSSSEGFAVGNQGTILQGTP